MSKFKVGDRVRGKSGRQYTVVDNSDNDAWPLRSEGTFDSQFWNYDGVAWAGHCDGGDSLVEIVASPIRTVTRREIVPGAYGIVNVSRPAKPTLLPKARDYTTDELRAAAKLFNEIADVLDENAKEAA